MKGAEPLRGNGVAMSRALPMALTVGAFLYAALLLPGGPAECEYGVAAPDGVERPAGPRRLVVEAPVFKAGSARRRVRA